MLVQNPSNNGGFARKDSLLQTQYYNWQLWEVRLPLALFVVLALATLLFTGCWDGVVQALAEGDLLLFSFLLLLGVSVYLRHVQIEKANSESFRHEKRSMQCLFYSILTLVAYVLVKINFITIDLLRQQQSALTRYLIVLAGFVAALAAIALAWNKRKKVFAELLQEMEDEG